MLSGNQKKWVDEVKLIWKDNFSNLSEDLEEEELQSSIREHLRNDDHIKYSLAFVYQIFRIVYNNQYLLWDEQIFAAKSLLEGMVVEMANGEGKTFTAGTAACAAILKSQIIDKESKAYIATQNDYLTKRDALLLAPVFCKLGYKIGVLTVSEGYFTVKRNETSYQLHKIERDELFGSDVIYCTFDQLIFDCIIDSLAISSTDQLVKKDFLIMDEVDSILLDSANKSYSILKNTKGDNGEVLVDVRAIHAYQIAKNMVPDRDFLIDAMGKSVKITDAGIRYLETQLGKNVVLDEDRTPWYWYIKNALLAHKFWIDGIDYRVLNNEIKTYNPITGRFSGTNIPRGILMAIQAKERVLPEIVGSSLVSSSPRIQLSFFSKYAGLTATAKSVRKELKKIYGLKVISIPRREPRRLEIQTPILCRNQIAKICAIVKDVLLHVGELTPVLVVAQNELDAIKIEALLKFLGYKLKSIYPDEHESEPNIVRAAGLPWSIVVSPKLVNRGTEIKIAPEIKSAMKDYQGDKVIGLYVIGAGYSEVSEREDQQLFGRSARRGLRGGARFIIALDDNFPKNYIPRFQYQLTYNMLEEITYDFPKIANRMMQYARTEIDRSSALARSKIYTREQSLFILRKPWENLRELLMVPNGVFAICNVAIRNFSRVFAEDNKGYSNDNPGGLSLDDLKQICDLDEDQIRNYNQLSYKGRTKIIEDALKEALDERMEKSFHKIDTEKIRNLMDNSWANLLETMKYTSESLELEYYPNRLPKRIYNKHLLRHWRKELNYFSAVLVTQVIGASDIQLKHPNEIVGVPIRIQGIKTMVKEIADSKETRLNNWMSANEGIKESVFRFEEEKEKHPDSLKSKCVYDAVRHLNQFLDADKHKHVNRKSDQLITIYRLLLENNDLYPEAELAIGEKLKTMNVEIPNTLHSKIDEANKLLETANEFKAGLSPVKIGLLKARLLMRIEDYSEALEIMEDLRAKNSAMNSDMNFMQLFNQINTYKSRYEFSG